MAVVSHNDNDSPRGELVELGAIRVSRTGAPVHELVCTWWDRGGGKLERVVEASADLDPVWIADELVAIAAEMVDEDLDDGEDLDDVRAETIGTVSELLDLEPPDVVRARALLRRVQDLTEELDDA